MVAHLLWEQGVAGSNPAVPTGERAAKRGVCSVRVVEFSRELLEDVLAGDITLSVRL